VHLFAPLLFESSDDELVKCSGVFGDSVADQPADHIGECAVLVKRHSFELAVQIPVKIQIQAHRPRSPTGLLPGWRRRRSSFGLEEVAAPVRVGGLVRGLYWTPFVFSIAMSIMLRVGCTVCVLHMYLWDYHSYTM